MSEENAKPVSSIVPGGAGKSFKYAALQIDGKVFAMLSSQEMESYKLIRDQGRKAGLGIEFMGADIGAYVDLPRGQMEEAIKRNTNATVHVITLAN